MNKYMFLGGAYVHGLMDGEAVDDMEKDDRSWGDFGLI